MPYRDFLKRQCSQDKYRLSEHGKQQIRITGLARRNKLKAEAIAAYGGSCVCCGESEPKFLTFDHINGGGHKERKTTHMSGRKLHVMLRREGYPERFQLLCWNCNSGRHLNGGVCPHQLSSVGLPEVMVGGNNKNRTTRDGALLVPEIGFFIQ